MTVLFEEDKNYYTLCAVITVAMQLFFFAIASTFKFDLVTDFGTSPHILTTLPAANTMPFSIDETAGSTNFILLAALTLALTDGTVLASSKSDGEGVVGVQRRAARVVDPRRGPGEARRPRAGKRR